MVTTPGTIDLGELPRGEPIEIEAPWPVRERLRRLRFRHIRWSAMAVGLAALVLATTGAPSPQPSPALTLTFTVPATNFALDRDTLYVLDASGPGAHGLTAYRLDDGAVRWRHTSDLLTENSWIDSSLGQLFAITYSFDGRSLEHTTRFDPETGRPLWTHEGTVSGVTGDRALIQRSLGIEMTEDEAVQPSELSSVDLATGDPVWSRTLTTWSYRSEPGTPGRLVALAADGRLATYDLDTGEQVASVQTSASPESTQPVVAGSLVLLQDLPEGPSAAAYDVDTLARRWAVDVQGGWLIECGRLLCVAGSGMPQAIQPGTGETAWSATWFPTTSADNWLDVVDPDTGWLDGYLVFNQFGTTATDVRTWLVEEATGEPVLDVGPWAFSSPYTAAGDEDPILFWHEEKRAWVGRLREDLSGVQLLGMIEVSVSPELWFPACQGVGTHAVCVSQPGLDPDAAELRVWRIP